MKLKSISLLVISAFSANYVQAYNHDVTTDIVLPFNQIDERYFLTNSSTTPVNIIAENGLTIKDDASFHLGFSGKTATESASNAQGDINMFIKGNFQIYNDTWIGKFDTKFFTQYLGLHKDFPFDPIEHDINVHVSGDINVELGADKQRGGLMILAGNVMRTGTNSTGKTTVIVDGDTNIRSGDNHLAGTASAPARLTTRTFNLTGGDIEIIGAKTVLETTNKDSNRSSVLIGKTGKMIVMREGTVDVSRGGNFDVVDQAILSASRGNGFIKLASDGELNVGKNATIESSKGSLSISDQTNKTSQLNIDGIVSFGISDTKQVNVIRGDNINLSSNAKFSATDDFIKNGLKYTTTDVNATVLAAENKLNIHPIQNGQLKPLIQNIYGDLNFKQSGNELVFVNASNVTNFDDVKNAQNAAKRQISRYYQQSGTSSKNVAKRFTDNLVKVAYESMYNTNNNEMISKTNTKAGELNWQILSNMARGNLAIESKGTTLFFNQNIAGLYNNNHGLHLTEIAMNSLNDTKAILDRRVHQFHLNQGEENNLWVNLTHHYENTDNNQGISGYKYTSNGFMLGFDKEVIDNLLVGSAIGYSTGKYKDKAASSNDSDIHQYQIQLYTSYKFPNNILGSTFAGYSFGKNDLKTHDSFNTIKEKFNNKTWNFGGAVGYHWQNTEEFAMIPSIGLTYIHTENSAHNVSYNQINLVKYGQATNSALLMPLDLTTTYSFFKNKDSQLTLTGQTGYTFNFSRNKFDSDITLNGINGLSKMHSYSSNRTKNQYNLGAGIDYQYQLINLNLDYQYFGQSKKNSHYFTASAKIDF